MRRLALVLVVALAGGGILAACGDDDSDAPDAVTDDTGPDDEATDDGAGNDEDKQLAESIVLTQDDVPEGFVEQDDDDDDDDFSEDDEIAECVDADLLEELEAIERGESGGTAESGYELDELVVGSGVLVMPDGELAEEFFELFSGDCFEDAFLASFSGDAESTDEAEFDDVDVEPSEDLPDVGDVAIEGFTVEAVTSGFELSLEFVVLQSGRAVAFVFTAGLDQQYPASDRDDAIETVAERMAVA